MCRCVTYIFKCCKKPLWQLENKDGSAFVKLFITSEWKSSLQVHESCGLCGFTQTLLGLLKIVIAMTHLITSKTRIFGPLLRHYAVNKFQYSIMMMNQIKSINMNLAPHLVILANHLFSSIFCVNTQKMNEIEIGAWDFLWDVWKTLLLKNSSYFQYITHKHITHTHRSKFRIFEIKFSPYSIQSIDVVIVYISLTVSLSRLVCVQFI